MIALPKIGTKTLRQFRTELRDMMESNVGILRTTEKMNYALQRLNVIADVVKTEFLKGELSIEGHELRNMLEVARQILVQSLARKTNVGGHFNTDLITDQLSDENHSAKLVGVSTNLSE